MCPMLFYLPFAVLYDRFTCRARGLSVASEPPAARCVALTLMRPVCTLRLNMRRAATGMQCSMLWPPCLWEQMNDCFLSTP